MGADPRHGGHLLGELDVGEEARRRAVLRLDRPVGAARPLPVLPPRLALAPVGGRDARRRVEDHVAVQAVHDQRLAVADLRRRPLHAEHGGDLQRVGEDRGVRGRAARLGHEPDDPRLVQPDGVGRRERVGDDDRVFGEVELARVPVRAAAEHAQQPVQHVLHVEAALAQHGVLDLLQRRDHLPRAGGERPLGVHPLVADLRHYVAPQLAVLEDREVGVEDRRVLRADRGRRLLAQRVDLLRAGAARLPVAAQFRARGARGELVARDGDFPAADDERLAERDPRGDGRSLQRGHVSAPLRTGRRRAAPAPPAPPPRPARWRGA